METRDNTHKIEENNDLKQHPLDNFLRSLTMLEKALDRLARQNYLDPGQKPEIFFEIESAIYSVREWIQGGTGCSLFFLHFMH